MCSGWNCLSTVPKKKSIGESYTIASAKDSWIKLQGSSSSSPLAPARSVCITPKVQPRYPRRNTNLHSFGVEQRQQVATSLNSTPVCVRRKSSVAQKANQPISRASKLDSRPFKTTKDFPTLENDVISVYDADWQLGEWSGQNECPS